MPEISIIPKKKRRIFLRLFFALGALGLCIVFYTTVLSAPYRDSAVLIHVSQGESIATIAQNLADAGVVRSPRLLQSFVAFLGGDAHLSPGDYYFDVGASLPRVASMLARGVHNIHPVRVTLPEGSTNLEMADILLALNALSIKF